MKTIKELYLLLKEGKYKQLIEEIDSYNVDSSLINPDILVIKSVSIQLCNEKIKYGFSEIERLLKKALELDSEHVNALSELAYYYINVENNPQKAKPLFEKAFNLLKTQITEISIGLTNSIKEISSDYEASNFINTLVFFDEEKVNKLKLELSNIPFIITLSNLVTESDTYNFNNRLTGQYSKFPFDLEIGANIQTNQEIFNN